MLLENGADPEILNNTGQSPSDVAIDVDVKQYLEHGNIRETGVSPPPSENNLVHLQFPLPIKEEAVPKKVAKIQNFKLSKAQESTKTTQEKCKILKIRLGQITDPDFIEIDLPESQWTYNDLLEVMLNELCIEDQPESQNVDRIRKLPNTKLRRDIEVQRLEDYTELELILES